MVVETDKLFEGLNGVLVVKGFLAFVGLFGLLRSHHFQIYIKIKFGKNKVLLGNLNWVGKLKVKNHQAFG